MKDEEEKEDRGRLKKKEEGRERIATDGEGSRWDARGREKGTGPRPGRISEKSSVSTRDEGGRVRRPREERREKRERGDGEVRGGDPASGTLIAVNCRHCPADRSDL